MESPCLVWLIIKVKPSGGQAGKEQVCRVIFFSARVRGRMGAGLLTSFGFIFLWSWPPFPGVVIVLLCSWGPPSAGRHLSSGSSTLNSCWEQLRLPCSCQWETEWQMWAYWASLEGPRDLIIQSNKKMLASLVVYQGGSGRTYFNFFRTYWTEKKISLKVLGNLREMIKKGINKVVILVVRILLN